MKKLALITLLLLAVLCVTAACADNTDVEPPTGSNPIESSPDRTQATTDEPETEPVTEPGTEAVTEAETKEETATATATVTETETESGAEPSDPRYIQFPLTGADDTTSYVSLPDLSSDDPRAVEFFILPTDTESPELTSALRLILPADGQANIQVVSYRNEDTYGFIFMLESAYVNSSSGVETQFVRMECASLGFVPDKTMTLPSTRYYHMSGGGSAQLNYTAQNRSMTLAQHRNPNRVALDRAENLFEQYNKPEAYEFTVLYSYIDGVETVNTPVESIPAFPFALFNEYGFDN